MVLVLVLVGECAVNRRLLMKFVRITGASSQVKTLSKKCEMLVALHVMAFLTHHHIDKVQQHHLPLTPCYCMSPDDQTMNQAR